MDEPFWLAFGRQAGVLPDGRDIIGCRGLDQNSGCGNCEVAVTVKLR
jgi:hypothetical protein